MNNEWTWNKGLEDKCTILEAQNRTLKTQMVDFEFNASVIMEQLRREKHELVDALKVMTNRYVELVESGDAGNWDPELETEVQQAREAIKNHSDES